MKISTKGIYSLKVMLYLANKYDDNNYISLNKIAKEENISLKYLEKIMSILNKEDFFITCRGTEGGYKLRYSPNKYTIASILKCAEGNINPVLCTKENTLCSQKSHCSTFPILKELNTVIINHLNSKTLDDYIERRNYENNLKNK